MGTIFQLDSIRDFILTNFKVVEYKPFGVKDGDETMLFFDIKDGKDNVTASFYIDGLDVCKGIMTRFFTDYLELAMVLVAFDVPIKHKLEDGESVYGYFHSILPFPRFWRKMQHDPEIR